MRLYWPLKSVLKRLLFVPRWMFLTALIIVLHNEYFIYLENALRWPQLKCKQGNASFCESVLIVADPQILNPKIENFGRLAVWDNDWYLKQTFQVALSFSKPDTVIFLGDLMDYGSMASDNEYRIFKSRFDWIFDTKKFNPRIIYLPGDNDIGGEGSDLVTSQKINRFQSNFPSPNHLLSTQAHYVLIERLTGNRNFPSITTSQVRVALSHIPLTFIHSQFSDAVLSKVRPKVIFSAHDHRPALATVSLEPYQFQRQDFGSDGLIRKNISNHECIEVIWPTSSYRMGVLRNGYGIASFSIENGGRLELGVLWSPSRFLVLGIYMAVAVAAMLFYCYISRSSWRNRRSIALL